MLLNVTPEQVIVADSRQTTFVGPGSVYIRQRKENSTSFDSYRHAICCNVHSQTNKPINYTSVLAFQDWAIHAEQHNKIVTILTAQRQCNNSNLNKALKWKIYKGRRAQGKYNVKKALYKIMTRFLKQRQYKSPDLNKVFLRQMTLYWLLNISTQSIQDAVGSII
jgi:MFS superfamily sulfate permease-like transporter